MLDWVPIIQKGAEALAPELFKAALKSASRRFQELQPYSTLNFEDNFATTYRRCTKIRTIVNSDAPVDLLSSYVNLSFTNRNKAIDDYELIDTIWKKLNVVVSGPAGCGKSMFMKYLWVSCFVQTRGKILLFIEVRQLNNIEGEDLTTFLFHSCAFKQPKNARDLFDSAIGEGQFFIILDGFDELTPTKADAVEREILKLANLGKNIIVVSGRPDDRFEAWLTFVTYRVTPLTKKQVVTMIERIEFDQTVKRKFISQIKSSLYDKHKDFISRPLLATMMLLTYNSFAKIPNRIHVFYDQAFDTLFSRHDATKEAFRRKRHTDYAIDEFKRLFGIFCLVTYIDQETDFTDSSIREYIGKAAKIARMEIDADSFFRDIMDAVCVIQRDGLSIVFSHRSFQEYFCAYSFLRLSRDEAKPVALRLGQRRRDSVISMLFEMNRSFLEDTYVIPMGERTTQFLSEINAGSKVPNILEYLGCNVIVQCVRRSEKAKSKKLGPAIFVQLVQGNEYFDFIYWMSIIYERKTELDFDMRRGEESDLEQLQSGELIPQESLGDCALVYGPAAGTLRYFDFVSTEESENAGRDVSKNITKFTLWLESTKLSKDLKAGIISAKRALDRLENERESQM